MHEAPPIHGSHTFDYDDMTLKFFAMKERSIKWAERKKLSTRVSELAVVDLLFTKWL